jgi:four helix bundle protein
MGLRDYRELIVWQKAMELVEAAYRLTSCFPKEELYGLTNQIRRAAVSVPSNIAEGQGRRSTRDFLNFLSIATGSLKELETQIMIAERLNYISSESQTAMLTLAAEVGRLAYALANSLRKRCD